VYSINQAKPESESNGSQRARTAIRSFVCFVALARALSGIRCCLASWCIGHRRHPMPSAIAPAVIALLDAQSVSTQARKCRRWPAKRYFELLWRSLSLCRVVVILSLSLRPLSERQW